MVLEAPVIHFFRVKIKFLPITHKEMTRFMITLEDGINLVFKKFKT